MPTATKPSTRTLKSFTTRIWVMRSIEDGMSLKLRISKLSLLYLVPAAARNEVRAGPAAHGGGGGGGWWGGGG